MLKKILLGLVVVIAAFLGVVALQPSEFRVARSGVVSAPAPEVFAQVNDFHKWEAWSPWAKLDPAAKASFDGPPAGKGAIFRWAGNNQVGEGTMTLAESRPSDLVRIEIDFVKPMAGTSVAEFTFKPQGNQTAVTWAMSGEKNFISKAICMFVDQDKMIGGSFEKGLASLKSVVEGSKK
jgi:hypothetical protein